MLLQGIPCGREYLRAKYHCTVDLLFDWFGLVCFANKNENCQLLYTWFQTSQTGGQCYSDTFSIVYSVFSIPWHLTYLPTNVDMAGTFAPALYTSSSVTEEKNFCNIGNRPGPMASWHFSNGSRRNIQSGTLVNPRRVRSWFWRPAVFIWDVTKCRRRKCRWPKIN